MINILKSFFFLYNDMIKKVFENLLAVDGF